MVDVKVTDVNTQTNPATTLYRFVLVITLNVIKASFEKQRSRDSIKSLQLYVIHKAFPLNMWKRKAKTGCVSRTEVSATLVTLHKVVCKARHNTGSKKKTLYNDKLIEMKYAILNSHVLKSFNTEDGNAHTG